jgi:hypothetical protein
MMEKSIMPTAYIEKLAKEGKGSKSELEKKWAKAKAIAASEGQGDNYAFIVGIFKKMIKEEQEKRETSRILSFSSWLEEIVECE